MHARDSFPPALYLDAPLHLAEIKHPLMEALHVIPVFLDWDGPGLLGRV